MRESGLTTISNPIFDRELTRFGPDQRAAVSLAQAQAYCSYWARSHYENFVVASLLLPRQLRQDFHNIYAYCRWSDNLADEIDDRQHSLELLDWWQAELSQCFAGQPKHPVLLALQSTIRQHHLSPEPFFDLLSAFRQDQQLDRYPDDAWLRDYCRRSADPVGRILLQLARVSDAEALAYSDHICTGLQLANFCQDMAVDARRGRIYVPQSRWSRHGVDESMLLAARPTASLQALLAEWVEAARAELVAGQPLLGLVPPWLRRDVVLFLRGGQAILEQIAQQRFDVWTCRPRVSKWKQFRLVCSAFWNGSSARATG